MTLLFFSTGFDSRSPYLQLDFKKLEVLHATFGIFSESPLVSSFFCSFFF